MTHYCHDCARLHLLLKLKRGELAHTFVSDTYNLRRVSDDIEVLEEELAAHMLTHSLLYAWPPVAVVSLN